MNVYSVFALSGAALCVLLIYATPACAYLDPGTGSMIVQTIIAVVAVVSMSVSVFWQRLRAFFGKDKGKDPGDK